MPEVTHDDLVSASRRAREMVDDLQQINDAEQLGKRWREIRQLHLGIESMAMRLAEDGDTQ